MKTDDTRRSHDELLHHPNKSAEFVCSDGVLEKLIGRLTDKTNEEKLYWSQIDNGIFIPTDPMLRDKVKFATTITTPEVFRISVRKDGDWHHRTFAEGDKFFRQVKMLGLSILGCRANVEETIDRLLIILG